MRQSTFSLGTELFKRSRHDEVGYMLGLRNTGSTMYVSELERALRREMFYVVIYAMPHSPAEGLQDYTCSYQPPPPILASMQIVNPSLSLSLHPSYIGLL